MKEILKSFLSTLTFFTILPTGKNHRTPSLSFLPWIGWITGGISLGIYFSFHTLIPFPFLISIVLLCEIWFTGGIHWEGLTDTFDALLSHKDKEECLRILKDPHAGVRGLLALLTFLTLRYVGLYLSLQISPTVLLKAPVIARAGTFLMVFIFPPLKKEGLGYYFSQNKGNAFIAYLSLLPIFFLPKFVNSIFLLTFAFLFVYFTGRYFLKKWGGFNGDILGAQIEMTQTLLYFLSLIEI